MEHKTPVVCLCEEMMNSIGVSAGDRIKIESNHAKIIAKCAGLTPGMQEFHDFILDQPQDEEQIEKMKPKLTKMYFLDPASWGLKSERLVQGEMTHPIFMDAIAINLLQVHRLHPVKIRKSLWWEMQKKLNSFGSIS
ncbi:MAG: hypothetical protein ACREAE_06205, partial [Nitrosopumilaceae archaeon]